MSLTDDWKAGKLKRGFYYIKISNSKVVIDEYNDFEDDGRKYFYTLWDSDIQEILAPIPLYEEYLESEAHCAVYSEENERLKTENAELIETNASLSSQVKHLLDLQTNQDKEVESLRDLLKECKNIVAHDLWSRAQFPDGQVVEKDDILTRINAAIGDNEIQANPVADIKIQER